MLANFWASPEIRNRFEISFSYRYTRLYADGLSQRANLDFPIYPLRFPDPSELVPVPAHWFSLLKRTIRFFARQVFTLPMLAYELWVLRNVFVRLRPDILHINNGGYPAALSARAAAVAARLAGVPQVIMVVNNLAVDYRRPPRWLGYPLDRVVAYSVSKFVTASAAAASKLQKVLRLHECKCLAIHNGIAIRPKTETTEDTRKRLGLAQFDGVIFGVIALMEFRKGHQVLLDALIKLLGGMRPEALNIKILFEGSGPLYADLLAFVANNQLSKYCVFVGDETNIMDFMALLDVLILPSIEYEDFPNVILEAMGVGKPVIASRLAGTPEQVVDGETGILVSPRDVDQLAAAIATLSLDKDLRLQMGQAGLKRFHKHFAVELAVKNYMSLYQSLIGNEIA